MTRLLLAAWPFIVAVLIFCTGFFAALVFCAAPSLARIRAQRDLYADKARAAEAKLRTQRLAPVLPLVIEPSTAEQRRGLKVVRGGRS